MAWVLEQSSPESSCQAGAMPRVIVGDPHSPAASVRAPSHQCIPEGAQRLVSANPTEDEALLFARDELSFLAASLINLSQNICSESCCWNKYLQ